MSILHDPSVRRLVSSAILLAALAGCRNGGSVERGFRPSQAASFETAISGAHVVGHAPDTCDLCDLFYKARVHVVLVRTTTGLGSGIVTTASGTVLTSAHVVADDPVPVMETYRGDLFTAHVLRSDASHDLALAALDESAAAWKPMDIKASPLPEVGSDVYVVGQPAGLGWTVTRGVVTATRKAGEVALTPLIQTDAAISPGNSGGPLLDRNGRLLGVVSSKLTGPGIESVGFAIPASVAAGFLADRREAKPPSEQVREQ